jgi:hypothetical protein
MDPHVSKLLDDFRAAEDIAASSHPDVNDNEPHPISLPRLLASTQASLDAATESLSTVQSRYARASYPIPSSTSTTTTTTTSTTKSSTSSQYADVLHQSIPLTSSTLGLVFRTLRTPTQHSGALLLAQYASHSLLIEYCLSDHASHPSSPNAQQQIAQLRIEVEPEMAALVPGLAAFVARCEANRALGQFMQSWLRLVRALHERRRVLSGLRAKAGSARIRYDGWVYSDHLVLQLGGGAGLEVAVQWVVSMGLHGSVDADLRPCVMLGHGATSGHSSGMKMISTEEVERNLRTCVHVYGVERALELLVAPSQSEPIIQ